MNPDLLLTALVGIAGIIGTLLAAEWSARNARELTAAQWLRDDAVAQQNQGKNAARAILEEVIRAAELFDNDHRNERSDDMWRVSEGNADTPRWERDLPEWLLAPGRAEVEPHYRAIRRFAVEIADEPMALWARRFAEVIWDSDEILEMGAVPNVTDIGRRLITAVERVVGSYMQIGKAPPLDELPEFGKLLDAQAERRRQIDAQAEAWMAEEKLRTEKSEPTLEE